MNITSGAGTGLTSGTDTFTHGFGRIRVAQALICLCIFLSSIF